MDSLVRRLAAGLSDAGEKVGLVHYGDCEDKTVDAGNGIELHYFRSLAKALAYLEGGYDHVVSIYLRPQDRIAYARFRRDRRNQIRFHHVFSCWNESWVKRELMFADARLFPLRVLQDARWLWRNGGQPVLRYMGLLDAASIILLSIMFLMSSHFLGLG